MKSAVSVGAAPVSANTPKSIAESITAVSHETFTAGMHTSFLVAAVVALVAAGVALITSRGHAPAGHGAGV